MLISEIYDYQTGDKFEILVIDENNLNIKRTLKS